MTVSRNGYANLQYGQQRPFEPGKPLALSDGQVAEKIDFALPRGSVISGRLSDESGEPIGGVRVLAMRYQYLPNGLRQLTPVATGNPVGGMTDDLGQFRVFGLMPGTYIVSAQMFGLNIGSAPGIATINQPNSPDDGYVTTYFPGTGNVDEAQGVTVGVGQEQLASFSMLPSRTSRISGIVRNSNGRPAVGTMVTLRTVTGGMMSMSGGGATGADGSFSLANVPPGEHFLDVRPLIGAASGSSQEFASVPITATGQDITGLVITTTMGTVITGHVTFEGGPAPALTGGPAALRIVAGPFDSRTSPMVMSSPDSGYVATDGSFRMDGASGRVVLQPISVPQGWVLKSIRLAGSDLTDKGFDVPSTSVDGLEVTLTNRSTTITGTTRDSKGQPVRDYVVAIVPTSLPPDLIASRFLRTVRPDQNGAFRTQGLPPGSYVALAAETLDQGAVYDPAVQADIRAKGTPFRLDEGGTLTLDLKLQQ